MILQRKVDVLNGNVPSPRKKVGGDSPNIGESQPKMESQTFWLVGLGIVLIGMIIIYGDPGATGAARWRTIGLVTLFGAHAFIIWNVYHAIRYGEKLHQATKFFIGGCLIFWSIAFFLPNRAEQVINGTKDLVASVDDTSKSQPAAAITVSQASQQRVWWNPDVVVTNREFTEVKIPPGVRASTYCIGDGIQKTFWRGGPPDGLIQPCGADVPGENLHDLRMAFSAGTMEDIKNPSSSQQDLKTIHVMVKFES